MPFRLLPSSLQTHQNTISWAAVKSNETQCAGLCAADVALPCMDRVSASAARHCHPILSAACSCSVDVAGYVGDRDVDGQSGIRDKTATALHPPAQLVSREGQDAFRPNSSWLTSTGTLNMAVVLCTVA